MPCGMQAVRASEVLLHEQTGQHLWNFPMHAGAPLPLPQRFCSQAMREVAGNAWLAGSVLLSIVSIAFFNFFGISVTKVRAVARGHGL